LAGDAAARAAPGPRGARLLATLLALRKDPLAGFLRATREHGDLVYFPLRHRSFYLAAHPADVARVLYENHGNYRKGTRTYAKIRGLLGNGLVTSDGETWRRQRRLMQPAFHHQRIAAFAPVVAGMAGEALEGWRPRARRGEPVDIAAEMTRLTLGIAGRTLLGAEVGPVSGPVSAAIATALEHTARRAEGLLDLGDPPTPGRRRFRRALARLDALVARLVEERRGAAARHDLLSLLLEARDERTGEGLDPAELRDQVLTLLLAGHETTATALTWTGHLLARHPEVQERLRREVAEALGSRVPTAADLPGLRYTRMVLQESMRLFPPFWLIERRAVEGDVLGGHPIPAGSTVALSPYVTQRHAAFWEDPDRFDPERFLPERVAARPRYAYFPFGGGPRACIGAGFAMMEGQVILAMLVQRYRLAPAPGERVTTAAGITLRPRGPVRTRIEPVA
jgi:cytochrome P450